MLRALPVHWCAAAILLAPITAAALPPNFADLPVADDWNQAVGLTFAPDGRMFVWETGGRVWNVENGIKAAQPLIDISEEVGNWRDYGLLGFAIDPDFYNNGYIYLLYVVDYFYLINDPSNYDEFHDTIARVTRYTCNPGDGYHSVDYGSRLVLIGETIDTGFPICHQSHGIGSLVFGEDGTLLASCGDAASYEKVDTGGFTGGSSNTCLSDGIIRPAEDVGAYRAQLPDAHNGKILRIDPATGDGVSSNPMYDPLEPRAPRSRVWALGLRNPFRMTLRPGSGQSDPAAADPGSLYIGDVGWYSWEDLQVCSGPGQNLGWPVFEGLEYMGSYSSLNVENLDAPNPLFGTTPPGQGLCTQQFFYFTDLLLQDTLDADPSFPNPCDPNQQIPSTVPHYVHRRPPLDWSHGGWARAAAFQGSQPVAIPIDDPDSPVQADSQFGGNCSVGGDWYTTGAFPVEYHNTYFHAEFGSQWIRNFVFDAQDQAVEIHDFEDVAGALVDLEVDPAGDALYYIAYDFNGCCMLRKIQWVINVPPGVTASAVPYYGLAPLTVQFDATGSDPDGDAQNLRFDWNFGDGTPLSRLPDPVRTYPRQDLAPQGTFIGKIFTLNPPHPIGGGNWDPQVMRDDDYPEPGNQNSQQQFDTYHGGDQGNEDWIGYSFTGPRQLSALIFQEGKHFFDGGWFDTLAVQARVGGIWTAVSGLTVSPPYSGNNGLSFEMFEFRFNPVIADAIRLYGNPGGSANFISAGELRVLAAPLVPVTEPTSYDVAVTVTDELGATAGAGLLVSINNSPPDVQITSPLDGSTYPITQQTIVPLTATIFDAEHAAGELSCAWQVILHHNTHTHPEPFELSCASEALLSPVGCGLEDYFYEVTLTVTDAAGLSTTAASFVYPDCSTACDDDSDCQDGNACTQNSCVDSGCASVEEPDGTPCGGGAGVCESGVCSAGPCASIADCADLNDDGLRDDICVWWACPAGTCSAIEVGYADLGGQFGDCHPDGTADANDRYLALNCFANTDTTGSLGFPCEENPPAAFNVDAGGQFGSCSPDGVCDGNDAFAALNAFGGSATCSCPGGGPAPQSPPALAGRTGLSLKAHRSELRPGELVTVEVHLGERLADLRGYQLHVQASGGTRGRLLLMDIVVERRKDHVFSELGFWSAFNVRTQQMVAGLDSVGLEAPGGAYLATFTFMPSADARGAFVVDLLHDAADAGQRTFLFPTPSHARIEIANTVPAVIEVAPERSSKVVRTRSQQDTAP